MSNYFKVHNNLFIFKVVNSKKDLHEIMFVL